MAAAIWLMSMPADPKNVIFLGFSLRRLAVIAVMLLAALILVTLGVRTGRTSARVDRVFNWFTDHPLTYQLVIGFSLLSFFQG